MEGLNILYVLGCLLASYHIFLAPTGPVKSYAWAQPVTVPLKSGDISTQDSHFWNFLAPLAGDVADRIRRKDISKMARIGPDLYEVPRSLLLHEASPFPENITVLKILYQVLLFATGALILKVYVVPLFKIE
jgi:hypothetical protein